MNLVGNGFPVDLYPRLSRISTTRMGKTAFAVTEAYTSKACCKCGALHEKLGGNKPRTCPGSGCGFDADRDIQAAFNIPLKFVKQTSARLDW